MIEHRDIRLRRLGYGLIMCAVVASLSACAGGGGVFPTMNNIKKIGPDALNKSQQDAAIKELEDAGAAQKQKAIDTNLVR